MTTALIVLVNSVPVGYVFIFFTPRTADLCDLYDLYDLYDLHDLAHFAGWEPINLHDIGPFFWVGSVRYRSCTTSQAGRLGPR